MKNKFNLGNEIVRHSINTAGQVFKRRLLVFGLPASLYFTLGVTVLIFPEAWDTYRGSRGSIFVLILFWGYAAALIISGILRVKPSEILIHENGILYLYNSETKLAHFSNIKEITQNSPLSTGVAWMHMPIVWIAAVLAPFWELHSFEICFKSGTPSITLTRCNTPNYRKTLKAIQGAYAAFTDNRKR